MIQDTRTYDKAANSELVNFDGKVTWAQVVDLNRFGQWSINLYPTDESLERLRELQLKNVFKKDDNGWYLQISRPPFIEFQKDIQTPTTPVKTRMKDGSPVEGLIGDQSDCRVTVELRKFKVPNSERWGNAIRLYGITVNTLVPRPVNPKVAQDEAEEPVW